ncbi:MAG: isoprenyl synthetase [Bacteroidetes bacterium RIFOXYA12_FULL_35_11]|nr:MAG: isoprenyl synthetase [Bacteroidetes bacterium GWF2_35_48]OFY75245.1 MAG: isoprenyl synthetase [Bacteroidetes bacterium RIFOXYA12_FULL_35_11]OFY96932.1 MAG: isoprenyl synthetase [Bacteroidetes bacterium RIFOXYB2_FULL_35_7]OFY97731.1 MAG: isoprenyl synthetase [Bacteroidetes bacterium RIFOXYC12_FULL_35_7]
MQSFKEIIAYFDKRLSEIQYPEKPELLYEPIRYILSAGGKRIRPSLTLMACNMYSQNIERALPIALAIETFHNFTLLHDDIMDHANMRRGRKTVHVKWNENVAILSGDAMSIIAYKYLEQLDNEILKPVLHIFNRTAVEICEGQQYDMDYENMDNVSVEQYLKMIELKTAVIIGASLQTGAIAGKAHEKDSALLYEFGRNIGIAFQLQDDFLDVYGDPKIFGKNIGGDILSNKKTFLLITALNNAGGGLKQKLDFALQNNYTDSQKKIQEVTAIYNKLGIPEASEKLISEYFTKAFDFISQTNVYPEKTKELLSFTKSLRERSH